MIIIDWNVHDFSDKISSLGFAFLSLWAINKDSDSSISDDDYGSKWF